MGAKGEQLENSITDRDRGFKRNFGKRMNSQNE